jgi:hydrogenase maturation protein HypF
LFRVQPEVIAHDTHPDYMATRYAVERAASSGVRHIAVQHHHAHLASCLAEHKLPPEDPVIGVIFDGTGLGPDGAIWGGEILIGSYSWYRRFAHLRYTPLPGGDAATLRPYRTALAHLWRAGIEWEPDLAPFQAAEGQERTILAQQLEKRLNAPDTSSMGRLFDAVASLAGVLQVVTYEAQAAIRLEHQVDPDETGSYPFEIASSGSNGPRLIDPAPALRAILHALRDGVPVPAVAARFHNGVADMIVEACQLARQSTGIKAVALSGGVFQNSTLLLKTVPRLEEAGFTVFTHELVPPNDGGIALGQAAIAAYIVRYAQDDQGE